MPTALALTYTQEGFVIAADGRERDERKVLTDAAQKIFPILEQGRILAYALCGRVGFDAENGTVVDLREKVPHIVNVLRRSQHGALSSYAADLSRHLYSALREATETEESNFPTEEAFGDGYVIFHLLLAGYYLGRPDWCFARFCHKNQHLIEPVLRADYLPQKRGPIYGPSGIKQRLFESADPMLTPYRVRGFQDSAQPNLSDGIEAMKNYVRACCDPEIAKLDPEMCAGVGGHLHLATITPNDGFEWVIPPKTEL